METLLKQIDDLVRRYYQETETSREKNVSRVSLSAPAFDSREAIRAIRTILGGWISQGPNVKEFEKNFAAYVGGEIGIGVNSGSSANLLALLALKEAHKLSDGDEVIVPAATFATVAMPIIQVGLVPVYVDVCRNSLNMDPAQIEAAISPRTKILMPVHTLGYPCDMDALMKLAAKHKLLVLEDCCEAHGSSINGKKVGSFGDIAAFSFFVAHNMTTGEGGMVVTRRPELERICRSLREFGRSEQPASLKDRFYTDDILKDYDRRYIFNRLGYNLRMTDVTAAFGIEQLAKLDAMNERRRQNADLLKKTLKKETGDLLEFTDENPGYIHTYYTFPMLLTDRVKISRREFVERLENQGIETRPLFAGCLPDQPGFRNAPGRTSGMLPVSRLLRDRLVFVGIHPSLDERHIAYMAKAISEIVTGKVPA